MLDPFQCLSRWCLFGVLLGILPLAFGGLQGTVGQPTRPPTDSSEAWHEDAWTPILQQGELRISYIYYPDADNEHDGVVLRLSNESQDSLRFAFTLIFRALKAEKSVVVQGRLAPGEMRTGDNAGLFWMPFQKSDRDIGEIGLRGLEIAPINGESSEESGSS